MTASRNKLSMIKDVIASNLSVRRIKQSVNRLYLDAKFVASPLPSRTTAQVLGERAAVTLENFVSIDGNVSLEELVVICGLARQRDAKRMLEVGTFDGNTTLQLARNTAPDSRILTLDLPLGSSDPSEVDFHDVKYINSDTRQRPRFVGTPYESRIEQVYGNSLEFDFERFCTSGKPDFIFIDAGHSYECVKNDSEKSLKILAPGGTIIWQDYTATWPGVYNYLNELSRRLDLVFVPNTTLVIYQS